MSRFFVNLLLHLDVMKPYNNVATFFMKQF